MSADPVDPVAAGSAPRRLGGESAGDPGAAPERAGAEEPGAVGDLTPRERALLVRRDAAALEKLYALYFDRVYGYVRRLVREEHLAEDVTQDVFMHLHRSFERYDPARPLGPWVFTIATNRVRDHWRSRRHREAQEEVSALGEEGGQFDRHPAVSELRGPDEAAAAGELSAHVAAAIDDMPEIMRTTFVLRYYEGLSFEEIGRMVDRNEVAVRKRYSRALDELRKALAPILGPLVEDGA